MILHLWCTCLGSKVCSYYADRFKDGTRLKFINNRKSPTEVAMNPKSSCEKYIAHKFDTKKHLTPGIGKIKNNKTKCEKIDGNY